MLNFVMFFYMDKKERLLIARIKKGAKQTTNNGKKTNS
jgi:hypothetical protein